MQSVLANHFWDPVDWYYLSAAPYLEVMKIFFNLSTFENNAYFRKQSIENRPSLLSILNNDFFGF